MTISKNNVRWKKDRIISIKLRNGHYALLQMISKPGFVAAFNIFRDKDQWGDVTLTKQNVLFTCGLVKNTLSRSEVYVHDEVEPVNDLEYEETRIHSGSGFREITLWGGTEHERTFLIMGQGDNTLREIIKINGHIEEKYTPIALNDYERYKNVEMVSLCGYPNLNERLYCCEVMGRNIDPIKELSFNRPLDACCRVYIDVIAGKIPLSELGY